MKYNQWYFITIRTRYTESGYTRQAVLGAPYKTPLLPDIELFVYKNDAKFPYFQPHLSLYVLVEATTGNTFISAEKLSDLPGKIQSIIDRIGIDGVKSSIEYYQEKYKNKQISTEEPCPKAKKGICFTNRYAEK
jgi:hypothetical protein